MTHDELVVEALNNYPDLVESLAHTCNCDSCYVVGHAKSQLRDTVDFARDYYAKHAVLTHLLARLQVSEKTTKVALEFFDHYHEEGVEVGDAKALVPITAATGVVDVKTILLELSDLGILTVDCGDENDPEDDNTPWWTFAPLST